MSWLSRTTKVNGLIKGISDVFDIAPTTPEPSPQGRRQTPTHKRRSTGREDLDRISQASSPLGASLSREGGRARRPTVSAETSPYNSLSRGKSASSLPPYDPNSPSLPAPLLLTTKLTASENALSSPNSGKRENLWMVMQESMDEEDLAPQDAGPRPLTAEENDRAAVWLEVEELRFIEDERLRLQSVKRIIHYLERGNITLDEREHLLHAFRSGSCGVEALELQRQVWQWLQRRPMPLLLQAAFIKGWERRVTRFPEALFREFLAQFGDITTGGWQMVEDREEVRVATRTYEALPVACVRGSTTILATPEELLDVLLHQGDTHAAWDELYARGIVRDSLSDNVHAIRVALKHAGTAARRELHLMRTWAKVDECYVIIMRSIPFTRHQSRAKHVSADDEKSTTTDVNDSLSESTFSARRKARIIANMHVAGYILRPVSYADAESSQRQSTQVVAVYSFDPRGSAPPESVHALNLRLPLSLHHLSSICYKRARLIEKLAHAGKIAPPLMVKALVTRNAPDPRHLSFREGDHITLLKLRSPDHTGRRVDCVGYLNGAKGLVSPLYISILERRRLSNADYHALLKLLSEPHMIAAQGVLAATSPGLKEITAKAIIVLFEEQGQALALLRRAITLDFRNTVDVALLLRGHEASALLVSAYSRLIALDFLVDIVSPIVETLVAMDADGKSFEVDPEKLAAGEDLEANRRNVISVVDLFMYHILGGVEKCPKQLRAICQFLQKEVGDMFPTVNPHSIIGGVMFLRFFCPALVSPVQHCVTAGPLTKGAQRGLIFVSKIIQQLSNAQSFGGGKEEHMVAFNPYITENIPIVKTYLTKLTSVPFLYEEEPLNRAGDALPFTSAEMTDLGMVLHYVIVQHLDDLHNEIGTAEVSHANSVEIPFKRLLEILFALPLPAACGLDDDLKAETKAFALFHNFTQRKRSNPIDGGANGMRRSVPFRISPFVTKNLETMVAPHAMPIAAAQQIVGRGSPTSSPLRRHSLRVDLPASSPLASASSASSASFFGPPPQGRAPLPAAPPSPSSESLSESLSLPDAHPQHRKPLPPPPHKRAVTSPTLSPTPSQTHSPSDSSPEAPGKERKDKDHKKEKKKHKKEKKEKKKVKSPDVGMGNVRAASPNP